MYLLVLILVSFLHATAVAPALLPHHRFPFDPIIKRIEYNSTYSEAESSGPQKWILKPDIDRLVLFRVILHEVIFPGNGQDCSSTAYFILTDSDNKSAIYCGTVRNRELRMLSLQVSIQIVVPSKFRGNVFANISYEFVDPSDQLILPVCSGLIGNSEMVWSCKPHFHAPTFSEIICVRLAEICDGYNQCPNGEDEETNICNVVNITSLHVPWCKSDTCFRCQGNASRIYNSFSSCQDGNAESGHTDGLERNASCPNQTFYCREDAKCLPLNNVCNGLQECIGLSDESTPACEWRKNHSNSFVDITFVWGETFASCPIEYPLFCPSDKTCLAIGAICNGLTDCSDGFDESEIVCNVASGHEGKSINQTALNYSTVFMDPTDVPTTNRTPEGWKETAINCKTDLSSPREVTEGERTKEKELCNSPESTNEAAADLSIRTDSSLNDHSTTVTNVHNAETASNCTQEGSKSDHGGSEDDFSNTTTSEPTTATSLEGKEFLGMKGCVEVPKTTQPSSESLTTESFSGFDYDSTKKDVTNEARGSSDQPVTAYLVTEKSIKKTAETHNDAENSKLIADDSELNLNSHSLIKDQSTPFRETTNENRTAKAAQLARIPPMIPISDLLNNGQENNESTMESLADSNNHTSGNVFAEPPVEFLTEPTEIPHTTESLLSESTLVPCSPSGKTNESEEESFNKSKISLMYHSHNSTDGLALRNADLKSIMVLGSQTVGEIAFPPLWIARVSSGSFFLCYGVLLAEGSPSRWVLIPASCGRYLHPSTMLVHFGAGIDNYEIVARVEQGEFDRDAKNGFSLLQLNSSGNVKHFIPQGIALTGPKSDAGATCKLLAPRHGYIYSFQLQNVAAEDPTLCSHKYGIDVTKRTSCFSQSLCLQGGLGGVLTCTNLTLGFYIEGADCYQGQIGWPVLVSVVNSDVLKWIWLTTGKLKRACGFAGSNGESFPWFTYFNLTMQSGGLCLGVYTQNDTFPLITSVRCLRQCLQSMNSMGEGCVLESVWSDNSWAELCAAKNIIQRTSAAASPWLQCLVAYLASPDKKGVRFELVRVSSFKDCAGERFYSPFMAKQGLCISAVGAKLNCSMWGESGLVQCQRAADGLWEFVGVTQSCFRTSQRRWFMRMMEL